MSAFLRSSTARAQRIHSTIQTTNAHYTTYAATHAPTLTSSYAISSSRTLLSSSSSSSLSSLPLVTRIVSRSYHERVIDHYENPRNVGSLPKGDRDVGTGLVGAPACGDVMKMQMRIDDKGYITQAVFKTFGCGSAIASSSLATSWAEGKHIDEVVRIKNTDIAKHLALPPVKLHCSMLAEDAIKAAVADYKKKQENVKATTTPTADAATSTESVKATA